MHPYGTQLSCEVPSREDRGLQCIQAPESTKTFRTLPTLLRFCMLLIITIWLVATESKAQA